MMKNKRYYGIDVGGTTIKIGLFEGGTLLEKWSLATDISAGGENILPDIVRSLRGDAAGAALAVPGAVLPDGTVNRCVNLGWGVCRPSDEFTALTGIPCRVLNDGNAAALGEQRLGSGKGFEDVLFVSLGTGVGAGVVLGGKVRSGAHGAAGELGHMCMESGGDAAACACGCCGCLEQYASATGISRLAAKAGFSGMSSKNVIDAAAAGNARLEAVVDEACDKLGQGIAGACAVIDPEVIVLGGGVAQAGEYLRRKVQNAFERHAFHACLGTDIRLAALGSDAGISGAALYAME